MSAKAVRVCPACRRPAQNRPLPPEGFWQEQVLQRVGMYPYRCEACGARFYRKVKIGEAGLGEARYPTPPRRPASSKRPASVPVDEPAHPAPSASVLAGSPPRRRPPQNIPLPLEPKRTAGLGAKRDPNEIPKVVAPPEATGDDLSHEDFVDLIDHISRSEQRKGLKIPEKEDEDN